MSLEPGGRAEKYGDEYENRYLAKLLLRLVNEDLSSVIVEPVGEHSNSVEFTTMSKSGTVSRAICTVDDGYLVSMKENTKIGYEGDKIISLLDDKKIELTGKEWVSMNFFGFSPKAFEEFQNYWDNFIANNVTSEKAEAYLPEAASQIVLNGKGKIKVYTSPETWFGMTYPEDRALVKSEIAKKIQSGYYPEKLWEK